MGVVDIDTSTGIAEWYRNATTGAVYTDSTLETALTASVEGEAVPVQVEAIGTNTVTFGGNEFIRLTAGELNVKDSNGNQIIWDSANGNIAYVVDGTPETSNMTITNVTPEEPSESPSEEPSEEPSETPSEEPSETPSETPSEEPSGTTSDTIKV